MKPDTKQIQGGQLHHIFVRRLLMLSAALAITSVAFATAGCASSEASASQRAGGPLVRAQSVALFEPPLSEQSVTELFDPCSELATEVLQAAGVGERSVMSRSHPQTKYCSFAHSAPDGFRGIVSISGTSAHPIASKRQPVVRVLQETEGLPTSAFVYTTANSAADQCGAAAPTVRGWIDVTVIDAHRTVGLHELCELAVVKFNILFPHVEGV